MKSYLLSLFVILVIIAAFLFALGSAVYHPWTFGAALFVGLSCILAILRFGRKEGEL